MSYLSADLRAAIILKYSPLRSSKSIATPIEIRLRFPKKNKRCNTQCHNFNSIKNHQNTRIPIHWINVHTILNFMKNTDYRLRVS